MTSATTERPDASAATDRDSWLARMAEIGDVTTLTPGELLALLNVEPLSLFGGNHGPTP